MAWCCDDLFVVRRGSKDGMVKKRNVDDNVANIEL